MRILGVPLAAAVAVLASLTAAAQAPSQTFQNPILTSGQDPSVVFDQGVYHLVQSDRDGISVRTSPTLTGLGQAVKKVVWQGGQDGSPCCNLWAPELVKLDGRWYIYYAADDGQNENHRSYVLEAPGPRGPYALKGKVTDPTDRWSIDAVVLKKNGARYLVWSGWEGAVNTQQNLYAARLTNPWTITGERVLISEPDQEWERRGGNGVTLPYINEAPQVLSRGDETRIVYSASGSWSDDYCLGSLTLTGEEVLDRSSWTKSDGCVFERNDEASALAPGHNSFTRSPDGTEDWQLYHAIPYAGASWGGRSVRAQPFGWTEDGRPSFGRPVGFDQRLPLPSGELEAEQATLSGAKVREVSVASGRRVVDLAGADAVTFRVRARTAGTYTLRPRFSNPSRSTARPSLVVNGAAPVPIEVAPTGGPDNLSTRAVRLPLRAGANTVRIGAGGARVSLDALTVTP